MTKVQHSVYVKDEIMQATIDLLQNKELADISIKEICSKAIVGRNSFYRNFTDKEDILIQYIRKIYTSWSQEFNSRNNTNINDMYGSLFSHLKENSDFYVNLQKRNLFHLFLNIMLEESGVKPENDNLSAYVNSFIIYGTYGWILEWIRRGMEESAETMIALLKEHGR